MRLVLFCHTAEFGGTEKHTTDLASVLAERGHAVTLVALGEPVFDVAGLTAAGVHFHHAPIGRPVADLSFADWRAAFHPFPADIAVFTKTHFEFGSVRLDLALRTVFPHAICVEHSIPFPLTARPLASWFARAVQSLGLPVPWNFDLWRHARRGIGPARVVTVCQANRRRLVREYRYPGRKIGVVHNGVDPAVFRPDTARRAAARQAWGVPIESFVFGAVGRLCPVKGYDVAIAAFARLRAATDRDVRLVLVGDGVLADDLKRQAASLGDAIVLPGRTETPWESLCGLDCFLMPSRVEGLPYALLEAMAAEVYPLATPVAGIPEVLSDPAVGDLVPVDDIEAWAAAMGRVLAMPDAERHRAGAAGRAHVVQHFDAGRQYQEFAELLEKFRYSWRPWVGAMGIRLLGRIVYGAGIGGVGRRLRRYLEWE